MKQFTSLLALIAITLVSPNLYAFDQEAAEAQCKQYAQEDEVKEDDMAEYLSDCIKDMAEQAGEEEAQKNTQE